MYPKQGTATDDNSLLFLQQPRPASTHPRSRLSSLVVSALAFLGFVLAHLVCLLFERRKSPGHVTAAAFQQKSGEQLLVSPAEPAILESLWSSAAPSHAFEPTKAPKLSVLAHEADHPEYRSSPASAAR